ncbi:hypothetical protein T484DRAFT_1966281 [Baffinella frigidus]|nr:hypothetical protein T484DRAFT_1966281 [Cryptophyta sp. CCMP2293]|mmetsp:Transcript_28731/g.68550  ORF Transcript_28731/g.68550 Transcript_28731/m.68550 type:complete len:373 (+) Transcript_28731:42-1160(+)
MDIAEKAMKDDLEKKRKKARFGDEFGRVGRRKKGQGKHFDEEAEHFNDDDDEEEAGQKRREANQGHLSSMKSGRDIKSVEGVGEDWEHSEDSEEEGERRKYEEESGFKMEPFNTDVERESGHFDTTSGHFVEDKFKMSQRDAWLDEVDDKYAHGIKKKLAERKAAEDAMEMEEDLDEHTLFSFLVSQMLDGESIAGALRRLKADKPNFSIDNFNKITEYADRLTAKGHHTILTDPKHKLQAKVKVEVMEEELIDDGRVWEYQLQAAEDAAGVPEDDDTPVAKMSLKQLRAFLDAQGVSYKDMVEKEDLEAKVKQLKSRAKTVREQVYGPFTTGQMRAWSKGGYFSGDKVLLIRQSGGDFVRSDRVDMDDMLA